MDEQNLAPAADVDGIETGDFTVNGKSYELSFSRHRISLYEKAAKKPLMASIYVDGGVLSFEQLQFLVAYGLKAEGGGYIAPAEGVKMAGELIDKNGYTAVYERVTDALVRDCGFLFR